MTWQDWLLGWTWFVPLGILGVIRWISWAFRRIPAVLYRPVENDFFLPLSIVVPVYKEDPELFSAAIESWLANDPGEIILVIDATDSVCQEIAARFDAERDSLAERTRALMDRFPLYPQLSAAAV